MLSLKTFSCLAAVLSTVTSQLNEQFGNFQMPQNPKSFLTSLKKPGPKYDFSGFLGGRQPWAKEPTLSLPVPPGYSSISQLPTDQPMTFNPYQQPQARPATENFPAFQSTMSLLPPQMTQSLPLPSPMSPFPDSPQSQQSRKNCQLIGFPPGFSINNELPMNNIPPEFSAPVSQRKTFHISNFENTPSSIMSPFLFQQHLKPSSLAALAGNDFSSDIPTAAEFAMNTQTLELRPKGPNQQQPNNSGPQRVHNLTGPDSQLPVTSDYPKRTFDQFNLRSIFAKNSPLDTLQSNYKQQPTSLPLGEMNKPNNIPPMPQQLQNLNFSS